MDILYITIIVVTLLLSFFFSGTETAFVSVNKVRVELWRRREDRFARILLPYIENPERFLYTTLIGNNIFNVAFASLATVYFNAYIDAELTWLITVLATLFIGEIIPKTLFRSLADWVVQKVIYPLHLFYYLFRPLYWVIAKISGLLLGLMGVRPQELRNFFSEKDIEILLNEGRDMVRRTDPVGGEFLSGILTLRELRVRDAMVPRTEIVAISDENTLEDLYQLFDKYEFTKIPVYGQFLDNVTGYVLLKDLFLEPASLPEMIRPVMFVPETKRCSELLSEFRANNTSIAIVIDEYGGTAGLITTEDLVEELFGEIEDEYDEQETWIHPGENDTFRVNARIELEKFSEYFAVDIPTGEYETLAGFIINELGRIPRRDETIQVAMLEITVTRATRRKVEWVRVNRISREG